jgi:hypothetical protein
MPFSKVRRRALVWICEPLAMAQQGEGSEHGAPGLTLREKRDLHVAQTKLTGEQMAFLTEIPADMRLQRHDILDIEGQRIAICLSVAIPGIQ